MVTKGKAYGIAPAVPGTQTGRRILAPPGLYTIFTFPAAGRIWGAGVSFAMGSNAGAGANQGYAQILTSPGALTLAIVECCVVGNPDADSNTDSQTYYGVPVPSGTLVQLDVNGSASITGIVQRASGRVVVSIP